MCPTGLIICYYPRKKSRMPKPSIKVEWRIESGKPLSTAQQRCCAAVPFWFPLSLHHPRENIKIQTRNSIFSLLNFTRYLQNSYFFKINLRDLNSRLLGSLESSCSRVNRDLSLLSLSLSRSHQQARWSAGNKETC